MTVSEPLTSLAAVVLAAALSAGITWAIHPLLQRYALARPNARSSHRIPTPQGAGIAVIAATLTVAGLAAGLMGFTLPLVLFGATVFIALVGMVDDIRTIPVLPRLLLQAAAVGAVIYTAPGDLRIAPALPLAVERGLLLLAGLWFVNLVNFMDGIDLITVAEVVPVTGALILLSWLDHFQGLPALVAMALCGAMLGFAPYNRPAARVFLGDVGSLPIGLLLGWCLLHLAWHQHLIAALLLPLYYLADATLTLFVLGRASLSLLSAGNRQRVWRIAGGRRGVRAQCRARGACGDICDELSAGQRRVSACRHDRGRHRALPFFAEAIALTVAQRQTQPVVESDRRLPAGRGRLRDIQHQRTHQAVARLLTAGQPEQSAKHRCRH